ncbi:MAG: preprotein translocase subunit SecG [Bacteroidetes bacterium]|nr:preprotein translocase subunit SecG [Bacteroidota bacterium]
MIVSIALILFCSLLIVAVLMQNSKGEFQSKTAKQVVSIKKANTFIEKTTWTLALLVMIFAILIK